MHNSILFLVAGSTQLDVIFYAKELGYYVITCDNNPDNPGHKLADERLIISTYEKAKIYEAVKEKGVKAVVNFVSEHGLEACAYLSEKLGLPGNSVESISVLTNKFLFRKLLEKNQLAFPSFIRTSTFDENLLKAFQFPLIVKPVDSGGNNGITKISNIKDASRAFQYACDNSSSGDVLFEEFLQGEARINGDCIVSGGKIVISFIGSYLYDSDVSDILPVGTIFSPNVKYESVTDQLEMLLRQIGYTDGALNFEAIIKEGVPYFIEINPRHSGNFIYRLINDAFSINTSEICVEIALGERIKNNFIRNNSTYSYNLIYSDHDGELQQSEINRILKLPLMNQYWFKKEGDTVRLLKSLNDRIGIVLLKNQHFPLSTFKLK